MYLPRGPQLPPPILIIRSRNGSFVVDNAFPVSQILLAMSYQLRDFEQCDICSSKT